MIVKVKQDDQGRCGIVETYRVWSYMNKGYIEVVLALTQTGDFAVPYVYRAGGFVPLSQIESEIGIEKYIKAKKPFYSVIDNSTAAILSARVRVDFLGKTLDLEKSTYELWQGRPGIYPVEGKLPLFRPDIKISDYIEKKITTELFIRVGQTFGNREAFLRDRL